VTTVPAYLSLSHTHTHTLSLSGSCVRAFSFMVACMSAHLRSSSNCRICSFLLDGRFRSSCAHVRGASTWVRADAGAPAESTHTHTHTHTPRCLCNRFVRVCVRGAWAGPYQQCVKQARQFLGRRSLGLHRHCGRRTHRRRRRRPTLPAKQVPHGWRSPPALANEHKAARARSFERWLGRMRVRNPQPTSE
jgi:hypothetical protein